jgi:hypothetical protein
LLVRLVRPAEQVGPELDYKAPLAALQDPRARLDLRALPRAKQVPQVRLAVPLVRQALRALASLDLQVQQDTLV